MTTIRLATIDDVPAILAISNGVIDSSPANFSLVPETLEQWERSFRDNSEVHPWLVAEVPTPAPSRDGSSGIAAFAKSSPWKSRGAYNWTAEVSVYVKPEHHRKGLARALYSALFDIMRAQGWRTVLGGITQPNDASVTLHESFGFRKIGQFERVGYKLGKWWDVGYWTLDLGSTTDPPGTIQRVHDVADRLDILGGTL